MFLSQLMFCCSVVACLKSPTDVLSCPKTPLALSNSLDFVRQVALFTIPYVEIRQRGQSYLKKVYSFSVTKNSKFQVSQFLVVNLSSLQNITPNFISCFSVTKKSNFQVSQFLVVNLSSLQNVTTNFISCFFQFDNL